VTREGNLPAQQMLAHVFTTVDRNWRGIGAIPRSGWALGADYEGFDAAERFTVTHIDTVESPLCQCTPRTPLGATMVSAEGACAAYYLYGRFTELETTP